MRLTVNGSPLQLADGARVVDLLQHMRLIGKRVAVEINGEIVPRSGHAETALRENDRVEIVQAIGGG